MASGGHALFDLRGRNINIQGTFVEMVGGRGGDAGDGGPSGPGDLAGGGGGGFTGGDGAHADSMLPAQEGGAVRGRVAMGGGAVLWSDGETLNITSSGLDLRGGDGGDAGDGGPSHGLGGGGGGGYSGGGGGAHNLWDGSTGGDLEDMVGWGGSADIRMNADGRLDVRASGIFATGGRGGDAGDGGDVSSTGGGGGGGVSGGGGGAQGPDDGSGPGTDGGPGGDGGGIVASGGDATVNLSSYSVMSLGSSIKAVGGHGGHEGEAGAYEAGNAKADMGGAGGGGLSGGGGAGRGMMSADQGRPGIAGSVSEGVAKGGDAWNWIASTLPTISSDTTLVSRPGEGATPREWYQASPLEGYDVSGAGMRGARTLHIPMSRPLLDEPFHEASYFELPRFRWVDVHYSTTHGNVTGYVIQVDDDKAFNAPEKVLEVPVNSVDVGTLPFDVHYWKVRAVYENGARTLGPESPVHWFSFYNAPPRLQILDPIKVFERQKVIVDLSRYLSDPDTPVDELMLYSADERVLSIEGMDLALIFPEPSSMTWVRFSVSDGYNNKWFNLPFQVIDVNDPPVIVSIGDMEPPVVLEVEEGRVAWFQVVAEDPENEELTYSLYTTWQDMRLFSNGSIRVWARPGLLGDRSAKLLVEDERHAITSSRIVVKVTNTPDPPEAVNIFGPKDGSIHREYDPITFTVKVEDPDLVWGEEVNVTWQSDVTGIIGTKRTHDMASITTNDLPLGRHVITITVFDGTYSLSSTMNITVVKRPPTYVAEEPPDEGIPPLAILMLVVMPILGYYLGSRGVGNARR